MSEYVTIELEREEVEALLSALTKARMQDTYTMLGSARFKLEQAIGKEPA